MKRLFIAVAILSTLFACSLLNAAHVQRTADRLSLSLAQADACAREDLWEQAAEHTRQAYTQWQENHFYLHAVMRHADTDQILRSFRCVLQYLDIRELDQYVSANADLICQIALLAEMEQVSLANVL